MPASLMSSIIDSAKAIGLNCVGIADGAKYQHMFAGCQSMVMFGNSGSQLWDGFYQYCQQHPEFFRDQQHPLDIYVKQRLEEFVDFSEPSQRWIRCSITDPHTFDFRLAAEDAGMGWRSPIGILLSPEHGLWTGLRAVCFTTEKLAPTILQGERPCDTCAKPCITECPGGAVSEAGWDYDKCTSYHRQSDNCNQGCIARAACPVGQDKQTPPLARFYHHNKPAGRQHISKLLGLEQAGEVADCDIMRWHKM